MLLYIGRVNPNKPKWLRSHESSRDRQTDKQTFAIVESLSRLNSIKFHLVLGFWDPGPLIFLGAWSLDLGPSFFDLGLISPK